ncbi:MAG TPA: PIG-L family deacetylase [Lacunisphaera sp.]|nr:PIG-L family deacetylase [Lacunisphaera sp.]
MPALPRRCLPALLATVLVPILHAEEPAKTPAILQELRQWRTLGSVLHVAAHPDDENTQLITAMARGRGYRAAYLSITRGDGGQNERGPDFAEKLGVLRTQELLAARRQDGGRQFFTRAIDYGYSKSPEEALRFWTRDEVLGDVVRVIRKFRPDVIITRFPIPPGSGGHGQHTASAILAVEAFKLAADPTAFPDQLREGLAPWQAKRIGWNGWNSANSPLKGPTIQFDIGGADPVTGEAFGTIANQSRGMHKTQMLGGFSERAGSAGPNLQTFQLLAGDPPTSDIMDGVDTTWARIPGGAALIPLIDDVVAKFSAASPSSSVPALLGLRTQLDGLKSTDPLVAEKRTALDHIIAACLGLTVETSIPKAEVLAAESVTLEHNVELAGPMPVRWVAVRYPATGSSKSDHKVNIVLRPPDSTRYASTASVTIPPNTPASQPYWLRQEGTPGVFHVAEPTLIGEPENPPVFPVEYIFDVNGQRLVVADEPVQMIAGAPAAQQRRPVAVIPPVSLKLNSDIYLVAPGATKQVTIEVTSARTHANGKLRLEVPDGWAISTGPQDFRLPGVGDRAAFTFTVTAPPAGGAGHLGAVAEVDGQSYSTQRIELNYPHLPLQLLQPPAQARLASFPLATKGQTVGYLPGAGDSVAECLEQMGYIVNRLTGADLTPEKLRGLDAVVIGVRAFNDRSDLKDAIPGLMAWVEQGGTVIAQYNRPNNLKASVLGPYPLSIEGPAPQLRVTDETAPVTILAPDHAAVNGPNKIGPADFEGWVQERGTYFPSRWDEEHYTPIFAMSDPGEAPLKSSLLIARHGKGHYVYAGIAFFRQLPAGVPGAYRLFANLVSLGK